jgi:hypothetical protein
MTKLLSCRYNMDTNRVEARFEDGTTLAIDCIAVEDEYGNTPVQRAELDWLLYNKPLEYAQMVLRVEMGHYLSLGCDHSRLPAISLLCTPYALREKKNQRIFVHIKCPASPMDFPDCKYDHQAADFQDEAVWGVIWLADK